MKRLFLLTLLLSAVSGCATVSEAGYFWGNYATTSYLVVDQPSTSSYQTHAEELNRIIERSQEMDLKVPPGIHAELGFMYSKLGDQKKADTQFDLETQNYPESAIFLSRLLDKEDEQNNETTNE